MIFHTGLLLFLFELSIITQNDVWCELSRAPNYTVLLFPKKIMFVIVCYDWFSIYVQSLWF